MKDINYYRFRILVSVLLTFLPVLNTSQSQQHANRPNENLQKVLSTAKRFEDIFEFNREITLKVDDIIGEITRLDVAANGNLLVMDRMTHKTWLFNHEGNLIKDINVENNHPGIKWVPMGAWFGTNKTIIILISGTRNLFLFDSTGKFIKAISTFFPQQYKDFVINEEGYIYGYATNTPEPAVKKLNSKGKIIASGGIFPEEYKNFIIRRRAGGLVIDNNDNIYQYNACGPEIYKLSPDVRLIQTFEHIPSYYKRLKEDYPDFASDPAAFIKKVNQISGHSTTTHRVHLLEDSLLLVLYIQLGKDGGMYLNFCDLDGNYYTDNKIVSPHPPILAAQKGRIYIAVQPEENEQGELPNPVIKEFKLKYD